MTGVRFYKSAANIGTHVGSLWTATGDLLASGTFTNESAADGRPSPSRLPSRWRPAQLRRWLFGSAGSLLVYRLSFRVGRG